jgi:hypothetical protein
MPAGRYSSLAPAMARAVRAMIGTAFADPGRARTCRVAYTPSRRGIWMSISPDENGRARERPAVIFVDGPSEIPLATPAARAPRATRARAGPSRRGPPQVRRDP